MEKDELIKFKEYFAERHNDDLEKNEVIQHRCNVARENYELEFASNRAVDRIIHDYDSMTRYVRLSSNGSPVIEENAKIIKRMVAVSHDIKRTGLSFRYTHPPRPRGRRGRIPECTYRPELGTVTLCLRYEASHFWIILLLVLGGP